MPNDGQMGTAKDGTPVVWVANLGRAVPVGAAKAMGVKPGGSTATGPAGRISSLAPQEQQTLSGLRTAAQNIRSARAQAEQFGKLNQEVGTGGIFGIPGVSEIVGAFNPKVAAMQGLSNAMIPGMHTTPGPMTDADAKMYKSAIPNPNLPGPANRVLRNDISRKEQEMAARVAYFEAFAKNHGTLAGADTAFNKYWLGYQAKRGNSAPAGAPAGSGGAKYLGTE